jgi:hypothetical protein
MRLQTPRLVSGKFDDNGRHLRNFLVDVKVVQLESVIVVRAAMINLTCSPFLKRSEPGRKSSFLSVP